MMALQKLRTFRLLLCALVLSVSGCEQIFDKGTKQQLESADKKAAAGDFQTAVKLYEAALDGSAKTAEAHYKLGLIYADRLKKPVSALHHFERYLALEPRGTYVKEAQDYRKEGEQRVRVLLTKGSPMTQEEAIRIRNDNLALRKALVELRAKRNATPAPVPAGVKRGEQVKKPVPAGARTYTVKSGDTLASIAAKHYKNKARWKDIQDANFYALEGTAKIKPGMVLIIP